MGIADDAHPGIAQLLGVAPVQAVGERIAYHGKVLMPVGADERLRIGLPVEPEAVLPTKLDAADADTPAVSVHHMSLLVLHIDMQIVKIGRVGRPQTGLLHRHRAGHLPRLAASHGQTALRRSHRTPLAVVEFADHPSGKSALREVAHVYIHPNLRRSLGHLAEGHEQAAARRLVLIIRVSDEHTVMYHQPAVAVDAPAIGEVQVGLQLARRIGGIVPIVRPDGDDVFFAPLQPGRHVGNDRQIAAKVFLHQPAVDPHSRMPHDGLEVQEKLASLPSGIGSETLAVPRLTLVVDTATGLGRQQLQAIGQGDGCPGTVVKVRPLGSVRRALEETPAGIHTIYLAPGLGKRVEAGRGKLRHIVRPGGAYSGRPT